MAHQQEIAKLLITIEGQITDLKKDLGIASREVKKFDRKSKGAFDGMKKSVTGLRTNWLLLAGAIGAALLAIKNLAGVWGNFEHKMHEVRTLLKLTNKEFENLKSGVLDLTGKVPQTAQELAAALYDIVSAGVAVGKSLDVLALSAKAAVAGVTDTKTAAGLGLGVINAYGKEISELSNVYDVLFQTVKLGVVTFPELASSVGTVLPVAKAAKVGFEDIAASIAVMTKNKIQAQKAATFMRSGIAALASPTKEAEENMKKMGITWKGWIPTLKQIHEKGLGLKQMKLLIPDMRAGQAIISLAESFDTLQKTVDAMDQSKGSMQKAFDIMEKSPVNRMKMLANVINELKIVLVKLIAPVVLAGVRNLTNLLRKLADRYKDILRYTSGADRSMEITKRQRALNKEWAESNVLMKGLNADLEIYKKKLANIKGGYLSELAALGEIQNVQRQIDKLVERRFVIEKERRDLQQERIDLRKEEASEEEKAGTPKVTPTTTTNIISETGQKATLDALRVYKANVKDILADLQYAYKENQITIEEYYTGIREQLNRTYLAEVDALENLLSKTTNVNDQKKIQNEITAKGIELQTILTKTHREEAEAQKELAERIQEANDLLKEAEAELGDTQASEFQRMTNEIDRQHEERVKKIIDLDIGKYETQKALRREFDLWVNEQEQARLAYEKEMQKKRLEVASQVTGTVKQIFDELYSLSGEKSKALFYLSKAAALADAAVNGALAIIKAYAVGGYVGIALGTLVSGLVGIQMGVIAGTKPPEGMAEGGSVEGSGGVDTIPKMLTRKEFVQPVSAVDHYGSGVMEAIRRKAIPRGLLAGYGGFSPRISGAKMAEGGMVSGSGNAGQEGTVQIVNLVDHDLFAQYLNTRSGNDAILNIISANAYSVKRRIGVQ